MTFFRLIVKNLRRNPLRSALTSLAVIVLVIIFSMILSVVLFLERAMQAKAANVPVVINDRYRFPSRFDRAFLENIVSPGTDVNKELTSVAQFDREKYTLWHFIFVTLDKDMKDKDLQFGIIATLPEKIPAMIDELEGLDPKLCQLMKLPPKSRKENAGLLIGKDRLDRLRKQLGGLQVGNLLTVKSISHREGTGARKEIELELEIVGELPSNSRWAQGAFMDYALLDRVLKEKKSEMDGKIMLGWLKFDDQEKAGSGSAVIERYYADVKSEIASTAVSRFLEPYMGILRIIEFVIAPVIALVMILIVANAVTITVRERTTEMAVLKVLGFRPGQILVLVLGEGLLVGVAAGLAGAVLTYMLVNVVWGGLRIPIGFFPIFFVPGWVFLWGPALGAATTLLGGIIPAWFARNVKVSEVFAKVA